MMKTPITVLQELMLKFGENPEYDCISQTGPQHLASFEYRCAARGETATAVARSKREAKQEAARALLLVLAECGLPVPPPYGAPAVPAPVPIGPQPFAVRSYVAVLRELCDEYKLPAVEYALVGDTGPAHLRHFTMRASIGKHVRLATATQKKAAKQLAAEALYHYLRDTLRLTDGFIEEEAVQRAHEKAMERYSETRPERDNTRPDLAQRPADFHLGLLQTFEEGVRALGLEALEAARSGAQPGEVELGCAAGALGMEVEWSCMPRALHDAPAAPLHVVTLSPAAPPLAFAGLSRDAAAAAAARYLRRALPTRNLTAATATARPELPIIDLLA